MKHKTFISDKHTTGKQHWQAYRPMCTCTNTKTGVQRHTSTHILDLRHCVKMDPSKEKPCLLLHVSFSACVFKDLEQCMTCRSVCDVNGVAQAVYHPRAMPTNVT